MQHKLILHLSDEFKSLIAWCNKQENMPEIDDISAEVSPDLVCPISSSLPVIPVLVHGRVYDLKSISVPGANTSQRVLIIKEESMTKQPITDPDKDIQPAPLVIRNLVSQERKKFAPKDESVISEPPATIAPLAQPVPVSQPMQPSHSVQPQPSQIATNPSPTASSSRLFTQAAAQQKVVVAGIDGTISPMMRAAIQSVRGVTDKKTLQPILDAAMGYGRIGDAEAFFLSLSETQRRNIDISQSIIEAIDIQFNNDKSYMQYASRFHNIELRNKLLFCVTNESSLVGFRVLGCDFSSKLKDQLKDIYNHMDHYNSSFDDAYADMLRAHDATGGTMGMDMKKR